MNLLTRKKIGSKNFIVSTETKRRAILSTNFHLKLESPKSYSMAKTKKKYKKKYVSGCSLSESSLTKMVKRHSDGWRQLNAVR